MGQSVPRPEKEVISDTVNGNPAHAGQKVQQIPG